MSAMADKQEPSVEKVVEKVKNIVIGNIALNMLTKGDKGGKPQHQNNQQKKDKKKDKKPAGTSALEVRVSHVLR
jgi:hypothetical protein